MWSVYLTFNVVLFVATMMLIPADCVFRNVRSMDLLRWQYWSLLFAATAFAVPVLAPLMSLGESVVSSWIPHDVFGIESLNPYEAAYDGSPLFSLTVDVQQLIAWIAVFLGGWIAAHYAIDAYKVHRIRRAGELVRRIGHVRIWVTEQSCAPFAYWAWGKAHVVLPALLLEKPHLYKLAIAHELQHHRQRDTLWLYATAALRVLCSLNPAVHVWSSRVSRLQEFACDEQMLLRRRWSVSSYADGLLETAIALKRSQRFACTHSLLGINHPLTLKRRIRSMLKSRTLAIPTLLRTSLGVCFSIGLGAVATIAHAWVGQTSDATPSGAMKSARLVRGGIVVAQFEESKPDVARTRKHDGIDIAAPIGAVVNAHRDGIVLEARERKGCGLSLRLAHAGNMQSLYCNLAELRVRVGDRVTQGQPLAELADLGPDLRSHLHLEIEIDGRKVDPAQWISVSE